MDKTTLGLIAAVGAFAASPAAANTPVPVTQQILQPRTVAELLETIPQPIETLAQLDAQRPLQQVADDVVRVGPLGVVIGHHHHHHHHHYRPRYHHHHHHHHHHNSY